MESDDSKPIVTVLVVDDCHAEQLLLTHILNSDPRIQVVGTADNGREAIKFLQHTKPNIITMDLNMPEMDGLSATREIMAVDPVPIIIVTMDRSLTTAAHALMMIEAGAVAIVEKPFTAVEGRQEEATNHLLRLVKNLSQVKLVHRVSYKQRKPHQYPSCTEAEATEPLPMVKKERKPIRAIAIGASTGGPPLLKALVEQLPEVLPVPVFITQHMSPGFTEGFSHWLRRDLKHPLTIPTHGEVYRSGCIYLAPCQHEMGVDGTGHIILSPKPGAVGFHSVSFLFKSVAREFGSASLAILLTGMGMDGARELKELRTLGAITVAQDEQSSVVHGMPREAIRLNGASYIMSPEQITSLINQVCSDC